MKQRWMIGLALLSLLATLASTVGRVSLGLDADLTSGGRAGRRRRPPDDTGRTVGRASPGGVIAVSGGGVTNNLIVEPQTGYVHD